MDSVRKALDFLGIIEEEEEQRKQRDVEVQVNLIITDYCMPGMTGYDLLRKIKESDSFKDIPVVIMSSENVPSRINRCLEEGADEFFLKPVRLSDVNKLKPHLLKTKSDSVFNKRKGSDHINIHSPDRTRTRFNSNSELEVV